MLLVRLLVWWGTNLVALWVAAKLVEGIAYDGFLALALAALVFAVVNLVIRPLIVLLALPAVILTLGIALLFINAFMLWLTGKIVPDFDVADFFWAAVLGALLVWIVNLVLDQVFERVGQPPGPS